MSTEYSERRVCEILLKANGQSKLAEQAVHNLIARDPQFLLSLTQPYLNRIIAHAIDRARKGTNTTEPAKKPLPKRTMASASKPAARPISGNAMDGVMALLAKQFEKKSGDAPAQGKSKVSQNHLKAMQALIRNNKDKK